MDKRTEKTLVEIHKISVERGGKCLSEKPLGVYGKYKFICYENHEFIMSGKSIKKGRWCQKCSTRGSSIGERICREVFEKIFNAPFNRSRPKWLRTPYNGSGLELDGYNEELKIAFEYHGKQHTKPISLYGGEKQLFKQIKNDEIKRKICLEKEILLVEIYEFKNMQNTKKCILDIEKEILKKGLKINYWNKPEKFEFSFISLVRVFGESQLKKLKLVVKEKNGKLLSETAQRTDSKLEFMCDSGHVWEAPAYSIFGGKWCLICSGSKKKTIEDMHNLAKEKNGKFLSNFYKGMRFKYNWECKEGHTWETTANSIQQGSWCGFCFHKNKRKF